MKLLVDTHAALWWLADDERLGSDAARQLTDESNQVLLSSAVVWEVAIKGSLGKLPSGGIAQSLLSAGVHPLRITIEHAAAAGALPWHHRDPFDRMLVAQALAEGAAIVSQDERLAAYDVRLVW